MANRFRHALTWKPGDGNFITYMNSPQKVNADQLQLALQFSLRHHQRSLNKELYSGKYRRLKPVQHVKTKLRHLNSRFSVNLNAYHPILLDENCDFVILLATTIHHRTPDDATDTTSKVKLIPSATYPLWSLDSLFSKQTFFSFTRVQHVLSYHLT